MDVNAGSMHMYTRTYMHYAHPTRCMQQQTPIFDPLQLTVVVDNGVARVATRARH